MVGAAETIPGLGSTVQLEAASPCSASVVLAYHFWPETSKVVVAKCDNYAVARDAFLQSLGVFSHSKRAGSRAGSGAGSLVLACCSLVMLAHMSAPVLRRHISVL